MHIYEWVLGWIGTSGGPTPFTRIGEAAVTNKTRPVAKTAGSRAVCRTNYNRAVARSTNRRSV